MTRVTVKMLRKLPATARVIGLEASYHFVGDWLCWTRSPGSISRDEAIEEILMFRPGRGRPTGGAPACLRWTCAGIEGGTP